MAWIVMRYRIYFLWENLNNRLKGEQTMRTKTYWTIVIGLILGICLLLSPGPAQAQVDPFGIYEDWSSPTIRSDRWIGRVDDAQEVRREVKGKSLSMRSRREGSTISNEGFVNVYHRIYAGNSTAINQIEADLMVKSYTVTGCEANPNTTRVRPAAISLNRFNDGSSPGPGNMIGDYIMRVLVNREANSPDAKGLFTVQPFLFRCLDKDCVEGVSPLLPALGQVKAGKWFTLRIIWDKPNHQFLVGLNDGPEVAVVYPESAHISNAARPFADVRMQLIAGNCEAGPTVTDAEILVGEIRTNVSAIIP